MAIDPVLDPLAAHYTGRMDMTVIGRVNMLDDNTQVPGTFGVLTDPDETTPDSIEWGVMALANHKLKLGRVACQLRLGQRVSLHGSAYPYRVKDVAGGIMMCLRVDQITPLPRAEDDGPTWGRVTVTGQTLVRPYVLEGQRIRGNAVVVVIDLSGQRPSTWTVQCYLEGEEAPERAGLSRVPPNAFTPGYEPGTWVTCSGRLGHLYDKAAGSLFVVDTQMIERVEMSA